MMKKFATILKSVSAGLAFIFFPLVLHAGEPAEFSRKTIPYTPEWGSKTISSTTIPKLSEYFRTYAPHRLHFQSAWVVANVVDEDGKKYNLLRNYSTGASPMVLASEEVPGLESKAKPVFNPGEMYLGRIAHDMDEEKGFILLKPLIPAGPSFSVVIRPQHIVWKDANGRIDLEFKALAPALEYYSPGRWEDAMYRSEPYFVRGTLNGKPVFGWGVLDMAWGPPGMDFTQGKIYNILEEQWVVFLNIFEDGSNEGGIFINGVDQFKICYYYKEGKARIGNQCSFEVAYTDDQYVKEAAITLDELNFHYKTESRIMKGTAYVTWASGRVINQKDPRKPRKTFAWFEFFPKTLK